VTTPSNPRALLTEGRKHDEAMTEGPWRNGADPSHFDAPEVTDARTFAYYVTAPADAAGIAWMRTKLSELLAGYAAAMDEIEAINAVRDEVLGGLPGRPKSPTEFVRWLVGSVEAVGANVAGLRDQRDALESEVERLRVGLQQALEHWQYPQPTAAEKARKDELWSLAYPTTDAGPPGR
jgi:hypothetical protein